MLPLRLVVRLRLPRRKPHRVRSGRGRLLGVAAALGPGRIAAVRSRRRAPLRRRRRARSDRRGVHLLARADRSRQRAWHPGRDAGGRLGAALGGRQRRREPQPQQRRRAVSGDGLRHALRRGCGLCHRPPRRRRRQRAHGRVLVALAGLAGPGRLGAHLRLLHDPAGPARPGPGRHGRRDDALARAGRLAAVRGLPARPGDAARRALAIAGNALMLRPSARTPLRGVAAATE